MSVLRVGAVARSGRTVVSELRADGLLRASRPLPAPDGAARVLTTLLGPGTLRGDRLTIEGRVGQAAHLILGATSAGKAYGGAAETHVEAHWTVAAGGVLELLGEPLVAFDGVRYRSTTRVHLEAGASLVLAEVAFLRPDAPEAEMELRTFVQGGERRVVHDVLRLRGQRASHRGRAVGTLLHVGAAPADESALAPLDRCADVFPGVRVGAGLLASGAIFARATADAPWVVARALDQLRALAAVALDWPPR